MILPLCATEWLDKTIASPEPFGSSELVLSGFAREDIPRSARAARVERLRFSTMDGPTRVSEDAQVRKGVLIVDDHADFRDAARMMLESAGFAVVGEASDGNQALASDPQLRPAVVLVDVQLPDMDGFAVAERLAADGDPPVVVLISSRDAASYGDRVAASSARGFIAKLDLSGRTLAELLR